MKRLTGIALVAGLLLLIPQSLIPQSVFANTLVSTTPVAGAALQSAPSAVTVTTELPLLDVGNEITVTDPTGARVDDGALTIDFNSAVIGLKPLVKSGIYTVNYSFLTEDDIPLMGKFTFNFIEPTVAKPVAPEPVKPTPTPSGNNLGTSIFVLGLLLAALVVTFALARYARKIYSER